MFWIDWVNYRETGTGWQPPNSRAPLKRKWRILCDTQTPKSGRYPVIENKGLSLNIRPFHLALAYRQA
jgi:hypothetical protein